MKNTYNFIDYRFAKRIITDVPRIVKNLDQMKSLCYDFLDYRDINSLMFEINEIRAVLLVQYEYYNGIYKRKAKVDDIDKK